MGFNSGFKGLRFSSFGTLDIFLGTLVFRGTQFEKHRSSYVLLTVRLCK